MSAIGQPERATQNRVIALFRDELDYRYLGDWTDRAGNSNIEEGLLTAWLTKRGYTAAADRRRPAQAPHRGERPQPQPLRQQPGRLQPAPLRRGGEDRGGQAHRNRPPHRLGTPRGQRLRHRRGGHAQGRPRAADRPGAVRQRHRRRRAGAEEQPRQHRRRHPAEPVEPAAGVQRLVLQHGAIRLRRQRLAGAAVRHHRHAGEVFPASGRRTKHDNSRFKLDKYLLKMCDKGRLHRADARLRAVRWRREEAAARASVFRHQGSAGARAREARAASSGTRRAAARASSWCCWPSGSWRTTPTPAWRSSPTATNWTSRSRASSPMSGEAIYRTSSGRDLMEQLGQAKPRLLCSLVHKFGPQGRGRLRRVHQGAGSPAQPDRGRGVRLRGRVPPDAERQAAPGDEGDDAGRGVYRLHRHAAAEEGQADEPGGLRRLYPHLQVQRGGRGRGGARPGLRGAGHRPAARLRGQDRRLVRGQDAGA